MTPHHTHKPFSEHQSKLTDAETRLAIAENCGWKLQGHGNWVCKQVGDDKVFQTLPDYPNDLNAMHEAEKVLDEGQQDTFLITLKRLVDVGLDDFQHEFNAIHATARQRSEALLRTLGLWKD